MHLWIIVKVALRNLRRTPLRSSLTTLGIVIGVAAVIAMVSIGSGARARVEEQLAGLDTNRLQIAAQVPFSQWRAGRPPPALRPGQGLTLEDYAAIRADIPGIAAASVEMSASAGEVSAYGRRSEATLRGIDVGGFELMSRRVLSGSRFGAVDVRTAATVCLVSESLTRRLFDDGDPIGRLVRVARTPFVVIGVLTDESIAYLQAGTEDTTVFIPYTSLLRRLDRNASLTIALKADDPADLGRIQREVRALLERRRGDRTVEFVVQGPEGIQAYLESRRTMTRLLGSIAGISLLVGGIGIMNIMLVSVTERTREIGLRLAIGTRGRDVLRQFLIESMVLSLLGGALGIVLGAGVARLLTYLNDWPTVISPESILVAFLCSAAIGVVFGYYPARQAARLDPIDALRFE